MGKIFPLFRWLALAGIVGCVAVLRGEAAPSVPMADDSLAGPVERLVVARIAIAGARHDSTIIEERAYDASGRMTAYTAIDVSGKGAPLRGTGSLDSAGRLVDVRWCTARGDVTQRTAYRYDRRGNIVEEIRYGRSNTVIERITYGFGRESDLLEGIEHRDSMGAQTINTIYSYDATGHPTEVVSYDYTNPNVHKLSRHTMTYDSVGRLSTVTFAQDSLPRYSPSPFKLHVVETIGYVYDPDGRMSAMTIADDMNAVDERIALTYDERGNWITKECYRRNRTGGATDFRLSTVYHRAIVYRDTSSSPATVRAGQ